MSRPVLLVAVVVVVALVSAVYYYHAGSKPAAGGMESLGDESIASLVSGAPGSLSVSVDALSGSGRIKVEYTCVGGSRAPRITVSNLPGEARATALIMYDPDAPKGTFIHWLALLPATQHRIEIPSQDMVLGLNSAGQEGYFPPCPPAGDKPHRYYFLVLALDHNPSLPEESH
ncbi:MAG: YbhB/YbcL family Raf kinase inhibitor-like protein [Desulfurococcales archaeon]|nr:YbhB/YbcL family Raf kinase inhibitor-like protein [Desulfurococcales archaeon]